MEQLLLMDPENEEMQEMYNEIAEVRGMVFPDPRCRRRRAQVPCAAAHLPPGRRSAARRMHTHVIV